MSLQNFRAFQLAKGLYQETKKLKLRGELKDQLDRASLSILLNLAEGSGKESRKDRRRFYSMAFGSVREVQAICLILGDERLAKCIDQVAAHTYKLLRALH